MGTHPIFESDFDCLTEMNTSFEYRINKKHGRPAFDLKDMLAVVEAVECEALATELSASVSPTVDLAMEPAKVVRSAPILRPQSCGLSLAANQLPRISDSLKKRCSASLSESRRVPNREDAKVYPRIIKKLDDLYAARTRKLDQRITQVREEYDREAEKRANERIERHRQHRENVAKEEHAKQEQQRIAKEQQELENEKERLRIEQQAKEKVLTPPPQPTIQSTQLPPKEQVQPVALEEKKIATVQINGHDARTDVFLKPAIVNAVIDQVKQSCHALLKPNTAPDKEIAMKIKRAVAVPVGALTQRSGEDLKTQIRRLVSLLKQQDIPAHPCAIDFVTHEIAFRLVKLAEDQLSSNEKASPAIAVAIVALWLESASFGELFMAHLFQTCPILLPNSFNFNEEIDEQRFKQMSGMCRLFASLASSDCPPGTEKHPFGIENVWKFIVGIVIAPNVSELSTQALYEVLVFSGKQLHVFHKNQFVKLVKLIASSFLPRATGAAATRLKIFLEEADKSVFADPPGMLQVGFWESKDLYTGKVAGD